jgi:hypothetical protein
MMTEIVYAIVILLCMSADDYVTGTLHDGVTENHVAHGIGDDPAGAGVLDGENVTLYVGLYVGILERQVGSFHGAVDECQIFAIAQGLGADDVAVDKGQTVGEPCQILAFDGAVADGDIFAVPEGVLGV